MSTNFDSSLQFVLQNEGGYVYDPDDRGGETNLGITANTLTTAYNKGIVTHNDVAHLTAGEAADIYRALYWTPSHAGDLPYPLDTIHFDASVNHGTGGAARLLQRAINNGSGLTVAVDGAVGKATLAAVNDWIERKGVATVANNYCDRREDYYRSIVKNNPSQEKFLKGWLNRNERCRNLIKEA